MYTLKSEYYNYKRLLLILLGSICKSSYPICFISCEINVDVLKTCLLLFFGGFFVVCMSSFLQGALSSGEMFMKCPPGCSPRQDNAM